MRPFIQEMRPFIQEMRPFIRGMRPFIRGIRGMRPFIRGMRPLSTVLVGRGRGLLTATRPSIHEMRRFTREMRPLPAPLPPTSLFVGLACLWSRLIRAQAVRVTLQRYSYLHK